ncbi:MAG: F0F1 ATP synthase subunit delta [Anaerolineae bacterium]
MLQLNWSTVLLQILDFVLMAFILWRFLFKPVVRILDERSARVTGALSDAEQKQQSAEAMRSEYEQKLADAEEQVVAMQQQAQEELARARRQVLDETRQELTAMRTNAENEIREARRQAILQHRQALGQLITDLSARMIDEATSDRFREGALEQFVRQLAALPEEEYRQTMQLGTEEQVRVELVSAYDMEDGRRAQIEAQVEGLAGQPIEIAYRVDPSLVAGAMLRFGDLMIDGSLIGQLERLRERYMAELEQAKV